MRAGGKFHYLHTYRKHLNITHLRQKHYVYKSKCGYCIHTKYTNNGKFCDIPEKDAGGGRETGNLFGVA